MKKIYFILAVAATFTFSSCMNDEFVGDNPNTNKPTEEAIAFGGGFQALTRADLTNGAAATKLGNEFKVYGVKQDRNYSTTTKYNTVFENYTVKYDDSKTSYDEYNNGWYYVGVVSGQNIKYWDQSSADYHFVAGSPVDKFSYGLNAAGDIEKATITGLGGRLKHDVTVASTATAVYIADPKVVAKTSYNSEVEFTFRSMQTKVRVGIYETIPGYKISSISFYNNDVTPAASNYITLNSATNNYFQGGSNVEGTVTYNWTTPGYTFAYSAEAGKSPTLGKYWEGGQFTSGVPATSSIDATNLYGSESSKASDGYFIVMPTPSTTTATPLTLKCDYTLTALDGTTKETIEVTGATATIPADYTKWEPNTAYTYLFKITNNTNGTTGSGSDPVGLYPITFDAVVVEATDKKIGTETTVSTPSITCYQNGDVISDGIKFVDGADITVKTSVDATITVQELTGAFDYTKSYEQQSYDGTFGTKTLGTNVTSATFADSDISDNTTYVIKAVSSSATAYFVLVVGAAENGPAN